MHALIESDIAERMNGSSKSALISHVWNMKNRTAFIDFFGQQGKDIWNNGLMNLFREVPFDGIWLDMNEVYTTCDGECPFQRDNQEKEVKLRFLQVDEKDIDSGFVNHDWYLSAKDQTKNSTYYLPFIPG